MAPLSIMAPARRQSNRCSARRGAASSGPMSKPASASGPSWHSMQTSSRTSRPSSPSDAIEASGAPEESPASRSSGMAASHLRELGAN